MVSRIPSVVLPWRPGAELQVGQGIPDLQPDAVREAPPLNARTGSPRPQRVIGHDPDGLPADVGTGRASTTLSACARSAFRWDTSERFDQEGRCGYPAVRTSSLGLRLARRSHSTIIRRAIVELPPLVEIDGLVILCHLPGPYISGIPPSVGRLECRGFVLRVQPCEAESWI